MFINSAVPPAQFRRFKSFEKIFDYNKKRKSKRKVALIFLGALIAIMFLPWTQNIQPDGKISTLNPQQRPQQINSAIAGRIAQWNVKDGDLVKKGDTLLRITEIKEEYLDPSQLTRVDEQIDAKGASVSFYENKATANNAQAQALQIAKALKLSQLSNRIKQYTLSVQSDSINYLAAENQLKIANQQLQRQQQMFEAGLKSLTEFEQRQQAYQDAVAKKISAENKFYNGKNELLNLRIERNSIEQDYAEKILKINGDRFSTLSDMATTKSEVAKLQNQLANYSLRRSFYVIIAPQSGQVIRTAKAGIGETVKEGDQLLEIVPVVFKAAVEIFINPVDLPLTHKDQKVRLQFDGFPAIVFSGWPNSSYGTFGGKIASIDPSIGLNGKFRAWVVPDAEDKPWPKQLSYGAGAKGIALLKDVPIVYELWRKLNGFPPEYYLPTSNNVKTKKEKSES